MVVMQFTGRHQFLSNFTPVIGHITAEHLFQASKAIDREAQEIILASPTAGEAKRRGRSTLIRSDWEAIKLDVMLGVLRWKFSIPEFRQRLLATGSMQLIEGNFWHDVYWGVCIACHRPGHHKGPFGENNLGKLLMVVRKELQG